MRLITIPIIIIIIFCLFALFTPVLLLQAGESAIPPDIRNNAAQVLADVSSILGRYDTTIEIYNYQISKIPDSSEYYGKKAYYLQITGRLDEALSALDGAISLNPQNPDYLLRKARILRSQNKGTDSDLIYVRIDNITPKNAQESVFCGDAALDRSKYLLAYDRYSRAVNSDPSDGLTWEKRGDVIFSLLTIQTAGLQADESFKKKDLYSEGIRSYENAIQLKSPRAQEIHSKIEKRSDVYTPKSIKELESRYTQYRYL
jgi:tetratricopeptide (TPR) repeat protein